LFVIPDNSADVGCPSQRCRTLTQYLEQNNGPPVVSNVEYHLLPGEHHVPSHTVLIGLYNFLIVGTSRDKDTIIINCLHSFMQVNDSENAAFANLIFCHCEKPRCDHAKKL